MDDKIRQMLEDEASVAAIFDSMVLEDVPPAPSIEPESGESSRSPRKKRRTIPTTITQDVPVYREYVPTSLPL